MFDASHLSRRLKDWFVRTIGLERMLGSDAYIEYARKRGCTIGDGTRFYGEKKLDIGYAELIDIGRECIITDQVRILAHIKDRPILANHFDEDDIPMLSTMGPVTVGDNVFIGERTVVLPDVTIGDNVIIGASSVVTSDIPSESVAVGAPCAVVMTLDEYRQKRLDEEASRLRSVIIKHAERGGTYYSPALERFVRERTDEPTVESFRNTVLSNDDTHGS